MSARLGFNTRGEVTDAGTLASVFVPRGAKGAPFAPDSSSAAGAGGGPGAEEAAAKERSRAGQRCGDCAGCRAPNCGKCRYCKDRGLKQVPAPASLVLGRDRGGRPSKRTAGTRGGGGTREKRSRWLPRADPPGCRCHLDETRLGQF